MKRIEQIFKIDKQRLAIFLTAGYPTLNDTLSIIQALDESDVDLIEIGMPFSDPLADGPVIREASAVALSNGMTIEILFKQLADVRTITQKPIVLMGYLNPVLQYGMEAFLEKCAACGIDGVILPDLPPELYALQYREKAIAAGVPMICMITPESSDDRIRYIDEITEGFIYMVSTSGTTGVRKEMNDVVEQYAERIRKLHLKHPTMLGFGIGDNKSFARACTLCDGAIVGSAFIRALQPGEEGAVALFVERLRKGVPLEEWS